MNILIFSTDDHCYPAGGAEQAMGEITKRLPHIQFDLICARLRKGVAKEETIGNIRIHRMGFGIPKLDGIILALFGHRLALRLAKRTHYDLIWSVMASYGAFSAVRVKKALRIPFFLTLQEGDPIEYILHKVRFVRKQFDEIFRAADGLQAISHFLYRWGKDMGFRGEAGEVIPNGVDIANFTKPEDPEEIARLRSEFGFPKDAFILLTSSRLEVKNGVADVVAALAMTDPSVCFVICGTGSLEEGIRVQVRELGLESRVRFMGFVKHDVLPKLLKASDAFIRPSLTEGLGNAFLEGMATRRPVIGTPVGGIPDFLFDGKTGFVCEPKDPESIARAVERIRALSITERERILDEAERMVREIYNWEPIAARMEALMKKSIATAVFDHERHRS
jgi:glycosyltransferase involved in cell wall biosynthesis